MRGGYGSGYNDRIKRVDIPPLMTDFWSANIQEAVSLRRFSRASRVPAENNMQPAEG